MLYVPELSLLVKMVLDIAFYIILTPFTYYITLIWYETKSRAVLYHASGKNKTVFRSWRPSA